MNFKRTRDESLLAYYEGVRHQVTLDVGSQYKFAAGEGVREYAERLREEIERRKLQFTPIRWK
jgi:hypothetical protein